MADRVPPIARIRLARSVPRLLLVPFVVAIAGAAAIAVGQVVVAGLAGWALTALGALVSIGALVGAVVLLSIRLEIEESAVGLTWIGGERVYPLAPGPVTRVRLRGPDASRLRARTGGLGWGLGRARLRDEEEIEVVRLAPTRTAILVPTERGRLAIAAKSDDELLAALGRAARARQRLEALADRRPAAPEHEPVPVLESGVATPGEGPEPEPEEVEPAARPLTGIERALLEERLAQERAAAAAVATMPTLEGPEPLVPPEPVELQEPIAAPEPVPAPGGRGVLRGGLRRPRQRAAFVLLPLVGAGVAWGVGLATGRMPAQGTDLARLTSLALVLAGPATSVGAIMALAWWPRLVGVVVAAGLAASVFIGRALLG